MEITKAYDVENYRNYGSLEGTVVFANALVERLKQRFPNERFKTDSNYNRYRLEEGANYVEVYLLTRKKRKFLGFFPYSAMERKRMVKFYGDLVIIEAYGLKGIVEEEVKRLNEISGAGKTIHHASLSIQNL